MKREICFSQRRGTHCAGITEAACIASSVENSYKTSMQRNMKNSLVPPRLTSPTLSLPQGSTIPTGIRASHGCRFHAVSAVVFFLFVRSCDSLCAYSAKFSSQRNRDCLF